MRLMGLSLLLALTSGEALAQACVVHSTAARLDVKVCQQNLPGQKVEVHYVDQYALPAGYSLLRRSQGYGVFEAVLRSPEPGNLAQALNR